MKNNFFFFITGVFLSISIGGGLCRAELTPARATLRTVFMENEVDSENIVALSEPWVAVLDLDQSYEVSGDEHSATYLYAVGSVDVFGGQQSPSPKPPLLHGVVEVLSRAY